MSSYSIYIIKQGKNKLCHVTLCSVKSSQVKSYNEIIIKMIMNHNNNNDDDDDDDEDDVNKIELSLNF